ncbi:MAG: methylmalonyl Co-A mutase-associated GTPase MeaB [Flavobacteriales bacterium]|nr:methylmalonyl Co-A mutase-associated GTPase MeaB [Flavobacteriales bacterium]|tara:strand:+ start:773 stop:1720 length:948 start_codon:yes stop_codon:yes gene_type:complete
MNLKDEILKGNRLALSKAITLLESNLETDRAKAMKLVSQCTINSGKSIRIGISGSPGVGKSTFIDSFGKLLTSQEKKIAVLAIDPSSERTYGSILGDKSRMTNLAADKNAFIRPSPSKGILGGIAQFTRDSVILCEAAGFDIIIIETVGVGQSETKVNNIVDFFLLLILSGAGDGLQGIKRGIIELADLITITKTDGNNIDKAKEAKQEYIQALQLFPLKDNGWKPIVTTCSAIKNEGIKKISEKIYSYDKIMNMNGWKNQKREQQDVYWLHHNIKHELGERRYNELHKNKNIQSLEKMIKEKPIYEIISSLYKS